MSPLVWAPKAGSVKGRTCMNLSKKSRHFPSVNESIDVKASDQFYLKSKLPLLPDVAEMACQQRDRSGGETLAGATVDVASAYHQFAESAATARYQATTIKVPAPAGSARKWIMLVIIYLVGVFGFVTASNIYCTLGEAIQFRHNRDQPVLRSLTYIDDGILISPQSKIDENVREYMQGVVAVFGEGGVNHEKVKQWMSKLEAIGWEFDFEKWTVQPKQSGLAKMMHFLFNVLPIGSTTVHEKDLERIVGMLTWYASGLPSGLAFTASLFACKCREGATSRRVRLSDLAMRDLMWWRAIVFTLYLRPHALAASIDAVRRRQEPTLFLRTNEGQCGDGGV